MNIRTSQRRDGAITHTYQQPIARRLEDSAVSFIRVLADETTLAVDGSLTSNTFLQAVRHRRVTNIAIGHRLVWVSARLVCVRERSFVCENLKSALLVS